MTLIKQLISLAMFIALILLIIINLRYCFYDVDAVAEESSTFEVEAFSKSKQLTYIDKYLNYEIETGRSMVCLAYVCETLEDVEYYSDYIVKATVLPDLETVPRNNFDSDMITLTNLEITETYRGDFEIGEIIPMTQSYFIHKEDGKEMLIHSENCGPLIPNREYVFFLIDGYIPDSKWHGYYVSCNLEKGRYLVPNEEEIAVAKQVRDPSKNFIPELANTIPIRKLGLAEENYNTHIYRNIYQDVLRNYINPQW